MFRFFLKTIATDMMSPELPVRWKPDFSFILKIDKQLRIAWVNLFEHRWVSFY
jgi:hypothetical protein